MAIGPGESLLDRFVVETVFRSDRASMKGMEDQVRRLKQKLDSAANITFRVGAGLTAGLVASLSSFAAAEESLSKIEGLVGVTREELKAWGFDATEAARKFGVTTKEALDGMFFVTSAGFRGAEAMQVWEKSTAAAASGLGDVTTIANLVTGVLDVYGSDTISAAQATDQLIATIREGKLDPATLAGPLASILPLANELGVEFGELGGLMAILSRKNFDAARGATALRGVFAKLIKPSKQGKDALEEFGLTMEDLRKTFDEQGVMAGLRTLQAAFGDDEEAITRVFEDVEGLVGVYALLGSEVESSDAIIRNVIEDTTGLEVAFGAASDTMTFKFKRAMAIAKVALEDLGRELEPLAKQVLDMAVVFGQWFGDLSGEAKRAIALTLALGPVLLGVSLALKGLSIALSGFLVLANLARGALFVMSLAWSGLSFAIGLVPKALALVPPALRLIVGVLGGLGRLLFGLPGLIAFIAISFLKATGHWDNIMDQMRGSWGRFVDEVQSHDWSLDGFKTRFSKAWDDIKTEWFAQWEVTKQKWAELLAFMTNMWDKAKGAFSFVGEKVDAFWEFVIDKTGIERAEKEAADTTLEQGMEITPTLAEGVEQGSPEPLVQAVTRKLEPVDDLLPKSDARTGPLSGLTAAGRSIIDTLAEGVRSLGSSPVTVAVREQLPEIEREVQSLVTVALPEVAGMLGRLAEPFLDREQPAGAAIGMLDNLASVMLGREPGAEPAVTVEDALSQPEVAPVAPALPDLSGALSNALAGLALPAINNIVQPLPVGPSPQQFEALRNERPTGAPKPIIKDVSLSIDRIEVHSTAADAREVASYTGQEISRQLRLLVEQVDSNIEV